MAEKTRVERAREKFQKKRYQNVDEEFGKTPIDVRSAQEQGEVTKKKEQERLKKLKEQELKEAAKYKKERERELAEQEQVEEEVEVVRVPRRK